MPINLNRGLGHVDDVAVPCSGRSPSRRDNKTVIGWIMFDNCQDLLTLYPQYSPGRTKKKQVSSEYRTEPHSIQVYRNAKKQLDQPY